MSEVMEPAAATSLGGAGAGRLLREAREAAGLHVAALAVALKVPVRKLEALEAERFEEVGEPVFVRGLAGSVCRALKVPAQPVLDRLPQGVQPRLVADSEGINTPFRAASDGAPPSGFAQLTRPAFLVVAALLLGALVLLLLPMAQRGDEKTAVQPAPSGAAGARAVVGTTPDAGAVPTAGGAQSAAQAASSAQPPAATPPASAAMSEAAARPESLPARLAPPSAGEPAQPAASASVAASPVAAVPATASPAPAAATASGAAGPAADGLLTFKASGPSWIEVSEAGGTVVLRRMLGAGESASASGKPPLKVTVGKADLTQVQLRGRAFDLQPYSHDNVARFEVK